MRYIQKNSFLLLFLFLLTSSLNAQVVTTIPVIPNSEDTVTVVFDATQGDGGLAGFSGDVYAHTGVITDKSTTPSDWKFVQGTWGQPTPKVRMTSLGNDKYQLKYHLRNFYGVPMADTIKKMAFVFRSADGNQSGRDAGGGDIFVDVATVGIDVIFLAPTSPQVVVDLGDSTDIVVGAQASDSIRLYVNQVLVEKSTTSSLNYRFKGLTPGEYELKAIAEGPGGTVAVDSFSLYVRALNPPVAAVPLNVIEGVNYRNDSTVIIMLYAPQKQYAFLIGSFNDWKVEDINYMNKSPNGNNYWVELTGLTPRKEYTYQFWVDGEIRVADPYAEKILDPWSDPGIRPANYPNLIPYPTGKTNDIVSVFQTAQTPYNWQVTNFTPPKKTDLVVYELHVRDFSEEDSYQTVIDSINYLKRLGINAIELMPVMEFENNDSWGYNPSFMFAVDKSYGTKDKLKELIDLCHANGIAVILDIVLNHQFGQSPLVRLYWDAANNRPASNSPWFNAIPKHDFNVGYDFNHESLATIDFVDRVLKFWIEEYKVDGYRFDLSKGFTQKNTLGNVGAWGQYDANRVQTLKNIAHTMWSTDPDSYVILEHFSDNGEEKELADHGMLIWGNHNHNYNEATMGYHNNSNFQWISYKIRGWNDPHAVGYMESHDEERLMYKNLQFGNSFGSYNVKDLETALGRQELAATFFFTVPGPKMIWQFGELGYEVNIDFNGRVGRKPIRWNYFQEPARRRLYQVYAALAKLRVEENAFETNNFEMNVGGSFKRIKLAHPDMNVVVLGNFDIVAGDMDPAFYNTGKWYEFFTGDSINVNNVNDRIFLQPGEYRLYTTKRLAKPNIASVGLEASFSNGKSLSIFPNPTDGVISLSFQLDRAATVAVDLMDLTGRRIGEVYRGELGRGAQALSLDLAKTKVAKGLYLLRVRAGDSFAVEKVWVK